jgi:hypothetical protein
MINWKYFASASILSAGVLFKVGAPAEAVAMGIALVALINWGRIRRSRSSQR